MKIKLSFQQIIITGLFLLLSIIILFTVTLFKRIEEKDNYTKEISSNYQPSVTYLSDLMNHYQESRNLFLYWSASDTVSDSLFRSNIKNLFQIRISEVLENLVRLSIHWNPDDQSVFASTASLIRDSLFYTYIDLISQIRSDNLDSSGLGVIEYDLEQGDVIFLLSEIEQNLNYLLDKRQLEMNETFTRISENTASIRKAIIGFTLTIILILNLFAFRLLIYLNNYLKKIISSLGMLAQGIIPVKIYIKQGDDFGRIFNLLNSLSDYFKTLSGNLKKILRNEFDGDFKPLSKNDELGIIVTDLEQTLKLANKKQQLHQQEEFERRWTAEGIARINETLRSSSDILEELGFNLIREIVEYTNCSIGALFILNNSATDEIFIELLASYAYERKKYLSQKIAPGEGLIGRCVQENETIFLTDVPGGYLTIKSGMGESEPVSILIVPIHLNENVFGVIELASFSILEPYKIKYVEIIGESIATTLSKVKINIQTTQLLAQTRIQAEEMAAQEEVLRQNMRELKVAQEHLAIREDILKKEIEKLRQKLEDK